MRLVASASTSPIDRRLIQQSLTYLCVDDGDVVAGYDR